MTIEAEPAVQADLSAYVLSLLDDHLAAMHDLREQLRPGGTVSPGGRRSIALDSAAAARRYADRLTRALSAPQLTLRHPYPEHEHPML